MYLIGFFSSPFPYIILVAAYLSGFVLYYTKGTHADEVDSSFLQENTCIASETITSENSTTALTLILDNGTDATGSLSSESLLHGLIGRPVLLETPPVFLFRDKKQFSTLYIRPPPQL